MQPLRGRVALVTGASRGVGKGVAAGLGEAGATVYITGRTLHAGESPGGLGDTLEAAAAAVTAAAVTAAGGQGIAVPCDHTDDEQVRRLFARIGAEAGRLDILVNNVWGGYEHFYDWTTALRTSTADSRARCGWRRRKKLTTEAQRGGTEVHGEKQEKEREKEILLLSFLLCVPLCDLCASVVNSFALNERIMHYDRPTERPQGY